MGLFWVILNERADCFDLFCRSDPLFFLPENDFWRLLTLPTRIYFSVRERIVFLEGAVLTLKWALKRLCVKTTDLVSK